MQLTPATAAWLGLRHTQLNRTSIMTNGDAMVKDERGVTTPWLALSHQLNANYLVYASYSEGLETQSAPSASSYTNSGQPLPALRSKQREVGLKNQHERSQWQVTWFDITRPATADTGVCDTTVCSCTRQIDGQAHHQGLELSANNTVNRWSVGGSAMWLNAKRENATVESALNGQRPINVPQYILRGTAEYRFASMPGLRSGLRLSREGERQATNQADGDLKLPAWTTVDATTHYDTKVNHAAAHGRWRFTTSPTNTTGANRPNNMGNISCIQGHHNRSGNSSIPPLKKAQKMRYKSSYSSIAQFGRAPDC